MISKMEQLEYVLNEIDQKFNLQMKNLRNLFRIINYLDDEQQHQIVKAIKRLENFFFNSLNRYNWLNPIVNVKQENFTNQETEMINSYIKSTQKMIIIESQIGEDLKLYFFSLPFRKIENDILSQNEVNYKTKFFQSILQYEYYGYIKNNQPEGRGISISENAIYDGYFVDGQFVYGLSVSKYINSEQIYQHFGYRFQNVDMDMQSAHRSLFSNYLKQQEHFQATIQTIFSQDSEFLKLYNSNLQKLQNEIQDHLYWYPKNPSQLQFDNLNDYQGEVKIGTKSRDGFGIWYDHESFILIQAIWNDDSPQYGLIIYRTRDLNLICQVGNLSQYQKFIK